MGTVARTAVPGFNYVSDRVDFLGRVGGTFWLWGGLQSLAVALVTVGLIYLVG